MKWEGGVLSEETKMVLERIKCMKRGKMGDKEFLECLEGSDLESESIDKNYYNTLDIITEKTLRIYIDPDKYDEHFMFKVHNDNCLCAFNVDGVNYGLLAYKKYDDNELKSWKDIHREYVEEHLADESNWKIYDNEVSFYGYEKDQPCKEFPHRIFICGCDDASYTKCVDEEGDAIVLMDLIRKYSDKDLDINEYIRIHDFIFTN
jgi:hypothetical protein